MDVKRATVFPGKHIFTLFCGAKYLIIPNEKSVFAEEKHCEIKFCKPDLKTAKITEIETAKGQCCIEIA